MALNIAKLSAVYFGGQPRRIEMLPNYHDGSEEAHRKTREVVERLDADCAESAPKLDRMLCLISATQTGSLVARLKEIFKSSSIVLKSRFVAIFALRQADIVSLYNLSDDHRFDLLEHCAIETSTPVIIDPQVYFPLQFTDSIIELDKALADRSRSFFDRYVGSGLVEVHRTHQEEAGRPRHHSIHLATERLVDLPEFRNSFMSKLAALPSAPILIVSPPHPAGRQLANYAMQYFAEKGVICSVHSHPNLYFSDPLSEGERELQRSLRCAGEDESLLVLDDVCITGTRLSQYQRYIRSEGFKGRIDYMVGIARPRSLETWTKLRRYLSYRRSGRPRHTVTEIEFILFPDWRESECPWCKEMRLYEGWAVAGYLPDQLVKRLQLLSGSMASGLTNELFVAIPGLPEMKLGPDSLFTIERANQAEVFAAVASSLQHLRSESSPDRPQLGPRHFPVSTVLNHEDYLCSNDELTYADADREHRRTSALRDLLTQDTDGEHDIALEVLLAANLEKCQVDVTEDLPDRLRQFGAADVFSFLLDRLSEFRRRG